jgi:hypothetical protein
MRGKHSIHAAEVGMSRLELVVLQNSIGVSARMQAA